MDQRRRIFGATGVSGAPGGEADDACAKAGIEAIADEIAFQEQAPATTKAPEGAFSTIGSP